jgi:hypothetical protein
LTFHIPLKCDSSSSHLANRPTKSFWRQIVSTMRVRSAGPLALVILTSVPSALHAQETRAPTTAAADPPRLRLFHEAQPTPPRKWTGPLKSTNVWKPPTNGSELPRWTIGRTAVLNGPGGFAFSTGFSGRRGDPMPLYLSRSAESSSAAGSSITGPGTYRDQWDLTFGVSSPTMTMGRAKVNAFGDLLVPVATRPNDPAAPILNSRALRVGIVAIF